MNGYALVDAGTRRLCSDRFGLRCDACRPAGATRRQNRNPVSSFQIFPGHRLAGWQSTSRDRPGRRRVSGWIRSVTQLANPHCYLNERLSSHERNGRRLVSQAGDGGRLGRSRVRRDDRAAHRFDSMATWFTGRGARSDSQRLAAIRTLACRVCRFLRRIETERRSGCDAGQKRVRERLRIFPQRHQRRSARRKLQDLPARRRSARSAGLVEQRRERSHRHAFLLQTPWPNPPLP